MLKRLVNSLPYLFLVLGVAAVAASITLAPSYRECAQGHQQRESSAETQEPRDNPFVRNASDILVVLECGGKFLRRNDVVLIAIAIVLIAFFTLALQRSTVRLWKAGERQIAVAEKAAEAAILSAQAAVDSERAHLFVSVKATNLEQPLQRARLDDGPEPSVATPLDPPCVEYVLSNYGRTLALLKEVKHGLTWESTDGLRSYQPGMQGPFEVIAPQSDSRVISCRLRGDFTSRDARSIVTNKRALSFFGEATFLDAFGHTRGVRWQCRCADGNFDLVGYEEYERTESRPRPE